MLVIVIALLMAVLMPALQRAREQGIVQGNDAGSARLKYLPHDSKAAVGDLLITSGLEGSFAKGLKIGEIVEITGREDEMFLKIKVDFEIDLKKIEEVLVIQTIEDES